MSLKSNERGKTRKFDIQAARDAEIKKIIDEVYSSLDENGYDPVNQISGYILTGDPTYITNHNDARALIATIDRDDLLNFLLNSYLRSITD